MYKRAHHQRIERLLEAFDAKLLGETQCFFGGGTAITLMLGEYRESVDVDFLCASPEGYRRLRNIISPESLGPLLTEPVPHLREVRADRYGIRTFLAVENVPIKVEIVSERRIPLSGLLDPAFPVPCLSREDLFAEKLLANTDRGLDQALLSRDLIDIAMMVRHWGDIPRSAWEKVDRAYGVSAAKAFEAALRLLEDGRYFQKCLDQMAIDKSDADRIAPMLKGQLDLLRQYGAFAKSP